ncbi:MAG: hypothetical protein JXD23_15490 [Spirochaetales bacterium]|nr:hypothetical protein [Spirochaetales bacterium]
MARRLILCILLGLGFSIASCSDSNIISLSREDLFTLNIGVMENQFDYFFNSHSTRYARNDVFFDDGIFFVVNGNAEKLMQFSPFGELTLLLYNPSHNPLPVILKPAGTQTSGHDIVSRRAIPVPFTGIGACGVDSAKNIYVEDEAEPSLTPAASPAGPTGDGNGAAFRKMIKRFDRLGNYLDTIGRTGVNGRPFPAIEDFSLTNRDHLVVVCPTESGRIVYWLDNRGTLLYEVQFDDARLPVPGGSEFIPTLGKIVPDYARLRLYIMVTYYVNIKDESTRLVSRIAHSGSRIYTFDLEKEKYEPGFIDIPAETGQTGDVLFFQEKQKSPLPYSFLGVSDSNRFFLLKIRNTTTYELLVLDPDGGMRKRIRILLDDTGMVSAGFHISRNGLLYALIAENSCAKIVRWRSDLASAGGS